MKTLFRYLPLLFALAAFSACSSDDDNTPRELVLSVEPNMLGVVETEEMDFEFEILDGNGIYMASVSEHDGDPEAKVMILGNKVTVNMLRRSVQITISDAKGKEQSFNLRSTNEILTNLLDVYMIMKEVGANTILFDDDFTFGAGAPYTIECTEGTAAEAIGEDTHLIIRNIAEGVARFKLRDKRGSILEIVVISGPVDYEIVERE